jgi:hypothetical protein
MCSGDVISKIYKLKEEDNASGEGKMATVTNIVSFDTPSDDDKKGCEAVGINLYTID